MADEQKVFTREHNNLRKSIARKAEVNRALTTYIKYMDEKQHTALITELGYLRTEINKASGACVHIWSDDGSKCIVCATEAIPSPAIDLSSE